MIMTDFGPTKAAELTLRVTSNGVIVFQQRMDDGYAMGGNRAAVFNDPREFAAWCEAWMAANVKP